MSPLPPDSRNSQGNGNTLPFLSPDPEAMGRAAVPGEGRHILNTPFPVFAFDRIESTLSTARGMLEQNRLPVWGSVIAKVQTKGRGQYDRSWESLPGNLHAALRLPACRPFSGSEAAPALGGILTSVLCSMGASILLKWPNDLLVVNPKDSSRLCKIGGMLIQDNPCGIIAGIGINLSAMPPHSAMRDSSTVTPGCLPAETLKRYAPHSVADFWIHLVSQIHDLCMGNIETSWQHLAEANLLARGNSVEAGEEGPGALRVSGRLLGLDSSGGLRILTETGIRTCMTGTITAIQPPRTSQDIEESANQTDRAG